MEQDWNGIDESGRLVCDHLYRDGDTGDYLLFDPGAARSDLADQGRDREIEKDI